MGNGNLTMMITGQVADFDTWKAGYDGGADLRAQAGVTAAKAYRSAENPNEITVFHEFANREAMEAFGKNAAFQEAIKRSGVLSMQVKEVEAL